MRYDVARETFLIRATTLEEVVLSKQAIADALPGSDAIRWSVDAPLYPSGLAEFFAPKPETGETASQARSFASRLPKFDTASVLVLEADGWRELFHSGDAMVYPWHEGMVPAQAGGGSGEPGDAAGQNAPPLVRLTMSLLKNDAVILPIAEDEPGVCHSCIMLHAPSQTAFGAADSRLRYRAPPSNGARPVDVLAGRLLNCARGSYASASS